MSKNIILDCERMKYPYTGLYYFCKELGYALLRNHVSENQLSFYVPEKERGVFGSSRAYLRQHQLHKFFPRNISSSDLWHCTYQGSNYLPAARSKAKVVSTIHDLNFLQQGKSEAKQAKYLKKMQRLVDRSDAIVTISNFVRDQILEYLDVHNKPVQVIYNGKNEPASAVFEKPRCLDTNNPFFFSIGTITRKKNFHVLPAMLRKNDHDLVIAGITQSQPYHDKIMAEARSFGVENRVKLIGAVSENEKYWLLKNCSAFSFPSLAEGFGLPVIEAMQFGTPVILSKATSLPEIGGPHALYFDDMDPDVISDTTTDFLNKKISQSTRQGLIDWASRFDWNVAARKYLKLYDAV